MADDSYDAIIVGAGHNGLVAAFYLARAGRKVLLCERRSFVGGACATEELFDGYRVSSCAYVMWKLEQKVRDDMGLDRRGLTMHLIDPPVFFPYEDGSHAFLHYDLERTVASIARLNSRDAERFPDLGGALDPGNGAGAALYADRSADTLRRLGARQGQRRRGRPGALSHQLARRSRGRLFRGRARARHDALRAGYRRPLRAGQCLGRSLLPVRRRGRTRLLRRRRRHGLDHALHGRSRGGTGRRNPLRRAGRAGAGGERRGHRRASCIGRGDPRGHRRVERRSQAHLSDALRTP